ncbi:sensor histidine kinase [Embleya sp. NPDC005575]|uniref:sensor histidine kinase n=1 Tax=Embleya sp. NPDC005575 TaxID=3156892 RepID=UPI0033B5C968
MGSDHPRATPERERDVEDAGRTPGALARTLRAVVTVRPVRNDVLLALLAGALDLLNYLSPEQRDTVDVTPLGIVLSASGAAFLVVRRRRPMRVLAAVLLTQAAFIWIFAPTTHTSGGAMILALYTVARYRGTRDLAIAASGCMAVQILRSVHGAGDVALSALADLATTALVIAVGVGTARWKQQRALLRRLLAERAVTEERRRIARELHDIVSHHITTMNLMSGGARATLRREPEVAEDALRTLEGSGRAALGEMRQLLGVLRAADGPDDTPTGSRPGMDDLERLFAESRAAGLPVDYQEIGERRPLPPTAGPTVYRIVQEALTNTRKYAGDARATVRVSHLPDRVVVEVLDDGKGSVPSPGMEGSGYGLVGMRERVALHGGTLETGPRPEGGFRVVADLPLPPNPDDPPESAPAAADPTEAEPDRGSPNHS